MRLADVVARTEWHSVLGMLSLHYPASRGSEERYERAFCEIQSLTPVDTRLTLHLDITQDPDEPEACPIYVYGTDGSYFSGQDDVLEAEKTLARIGLAYTPWEEWLGMQIGSDLPGYTDAEIAAHCLFEMTSLGFSRSAVCRRIAATRRRFADTENSNCEG